MERRCAIVASRVYINAFFEQRANYSLAAASSCKVEKRFVARVVSATRVETFLQEQPEEPIEAFPGRPVQRAVNGLSIIPVDTPGEGCGLVKGVSEEGGKATIDAEKRVEVVERQQRAGDDEELVGKAEEGHCKRQVCYLLDQPMLSSPPKAQLGT